MENISSGSALDFSLMLSLDKATPEQLERLFEPIGSQDSSTAGGQSVVQQAEVFARHQVRVAAPRASASYRLSHYDPFGNKGQTTDCPNTLQAPPVRRLSSQPVFEAGPDGAGLPSINQREPESNWLSGAINHNDSERRVTSYPSDNPAKASSADRFSPVMRTYINRFAWRPWCKAAMQQQRIDNPRHGEVIAALRYKILSRSFDKSNRPVAQQSSRSLMAPSNPKTPQ